MHSLAKQGVLLVDDEPQILVALEDLLSDEFLVYKAGSGADALSLMAEQDDIAVVVTDQRMPNMAGDELVARIERSHEAQRIMVTGYADLASVVRAVNDGRIFAYVTKPWNEADLRLKVSRAAEQFRLSRELASEKQLLDDLMNNSPDGIYFKDNHLRFIRANETIASWLGCEVSSLVGKKLSDVMRPEAEARRIEDAEMTSLRSGEPILDELRSVSSGDVVRWYSETKAPVRGVAQESVGLIGVCRDITRQRDLEDQLLQSQKMEAVGRLAGGIAHDFNNLLVVIQSYGMFLQQGFAEQDPRRVEVQELLKASDRAAELTRQLLTFSRRRPTKTTLLDINEVVSDVVKMLRRLVHENIQLEVELAPTLGKVRADATRLEQVVLNLAINARDAMPDGGKLLLRTELIAGDAEEQGPRACLSVEDTGVGMTPEIRTKIFEPFFTTKGVGKGTGLGLSTVYGIVRQLGGEITVETESGHGATFNVLFPISTEAESPARPPRPATPMPAGNETILVVDDNEAVRQVAARILAQEGYTVVQASCPSEALRLGEELDGDIDLLLTDVVMPEMDGPSLARALGRLRPGIRLLCMSGYVEDDPTILELDPGRSHYLEKPFTPMGLIGAVREVLRS